MKAKGKARSDTKKMQRWGIVTMIALVLFVIVFGSFLFNEPGQLLLKSGSDYSIAWAKSMDDYGLSFYIMEHGETGELMACSTKHSMFGKQKAHKPTEYVSEGVAQLYTAMPYVENGKAKTESLALFAQRMPDIENYEQVNFEYKALTDIEVSIVDDIIIVLCTTRTDMNSYEELLEAALEEARVDE